MSASAFNAHIRLAALGHTIIACAKLLAALWTGSAALMATSVHALADASSLGMIQSNPSRETAASEPTSTYFWTYIGAILVFSLGAGVTITQGIERLRAPLPGQGGLLSILIVTAGLMFHLAWRWRVVTTTKPAASPSDAMIGMIANPDPTIRTAMLVNASGIAGGALAIASLAATELAGLASAEALGSIAIGLVQGFVAASLAIETKKALARLEQRQSPQAEAAAHASVSAVVMSVPVSLEPARLPIIPEAIRPAEPPKRNHPPSAPGRKAKKRRR